MICFSVAISVYEDGFVCYTCTWYRLKASINNGKLPPEINRLSFSETLTTVVYSNAKYSITAFRHLTMSC